MQRKFRTNSLSIKKLHRSMLCKDLNSWLSDVLSVFAFIFFCLSPHFQGFILPQQDQQHIWHMQSLQNIQLSPIFPSTTPTTSLTWRWHLLKMTLTLSSQTKLGQSAARSQLHTCRISNQPHPLIQLPSSPYVPSRRPKYTNFSSPAILQHVL